HDGVLYIGGIIAEDTSLDMVGQADDVLRQLTKLLAEGGSSIARVLQVTIYATDLAEKSDFNRVWKAHFKEVDLPARAMIGVADLGAGVKLELVGTAAMDTEGARPSRSGATCLPKPIGPRKGPLLRDQEAC